MCENRIEIKYETISRSLAELGEATKQLFRGDLDSDMMQSVTAVFQLVHKVYQPVNKPEEDVKFYVDRRETTND
jgi:hypothetical protein